MQSVFARFRCLTTKTQPICEWNWRWNDSVVRDWSAIEPVSADISVSSITVDVDAAVRKPVKLVIVRGH
jgi:hypothetical protein